MNNSMFLNNEVTGKATNTLFQWTSLSLLSALPFLFTLHGDFVFDDSEAIIKNKDITADSWADCFHNDFWGTDIKCNLSHKSYRPLTIISFRLNYFLNNKELSAFSFKVTNLLCHLICTILVWYTYKSIVDTKQTKHYKYDISYLGALLFAVHPIHVEAISGIVGRADLLCGIAFFLAFLCYNKAINSLKCGSIYLLLSVISSALSMLCKENGITVLGFCLCYDIINNFNNVRKNPKFNKCNKKIVTRIAVILISIIVLLYARWIVMGGTKPEFKVIDNPAAFANNTVTKMITHSYIYFLNTLLLSWPQWLCYDWSMGCVPLLQTVLDHRIIFPIMFYLFGIFIIHAIVGKRNKTATKRVLMLSVALMVVPFLPAANIFFPVGFVIAERVLYIPSAGYCLMIALGLNKIISKSSLSKLGVIAYIFLITIYGLRSWHRSYDWLNEYNLFVSGLAVCPLNAKIHYNIAKVTDAQNETNIALASYEEALRLYPEYYQAMNNLANLLKNQKKYSEAEYYLRNALEHKQDFPAAWMNLGIVLASTKRLEESEEAYKSALQYRRNYPDCYYNLGNLYLEMKRTEDAVENWLQAVQLNSKHVLAWTNIIALLDNTEQLDRALHMIPKALSKLPNSPSINFAVANIYGKLERFEESERYFLKAIKLFGSKVHAIHYANLGVLYHRWKNYSKAEIMYKNALRIDPSFKSAIKNLKNVQQYNHR